MAESHEHEQATETARETNTWVAGGGAGLIGGIGMGIWLQVMMTPVITTAIPAMYGLNGLAVGWVAHLFHSVVFGVVFAAAVVSIPSLADYADKVSTGAGLGITYGVVLWIGAAGLVMPIWLSVVGFPGAPPFPNFNPMSLVGHAVYGVILGILFPVIWNQ